MIRRTSQPFVVWFYVTDLASTAPVGGSAAIP